MFLQKLDNNNGHSALNFVTVILMLMVLTAGLLDLLNIVVVRSALNREAAIITEHCMIQSGFRASVPSDWTQVYDNGDYWTSGTAKEYFVKGMKKTTVNPDTLKIQLGGRDIVPGADVIIAYQESSEIVAKCKYSYSYLKPFGLKEPVELKVTNPVTGFWIHKNNRV